MNHSAPHRFLLLSAVLVLGAACREPAPPAASQATSARPRLPQATPGAPFDLGAVVRRVHFAYRPEETGWSAGHGTWISRVTADGLTFTPRHALVAPREDSSRVLTGSPATFGAASLTLGGSRLEAAAGAGRVREDGSLALARGEVEEQFLNSEDGVERRWQFARAPRGEGDLRLVSVRRMMCCRGLRADGSRARRRARAG